MVFWGFCAECKEEEVIVTCLLRKEILLSAVEMVAECLRQKDMLLTAVEIVAECLHHKDMLLSAVEMVAEVSSTASCWNKDVEVVCSMN